MGLATYITLFRIVVPFCVLFGGDYFSCHFLNYQGIDLQGNQQSIVFALRSFEAMTWKNENCYFPLFFRKSELGNLTYIFQKNHKFLLHCFQGISNRRVIIVVISHCHFSIVYNDYCSSPCESHRLTYPLAFLRHTKLRKE